MQIFDVQFKKQTYPNTNKFVFNLFVVFILFNYFLGLFLFKLTLFFGGANICYPLSCICSFNKAITIFLWPDQGAN